MIQRIQTIYLFAAMLLCIGCLCTPVARFTVLHSGEEVVMYNLWLASEQSGHCFSYCPVMLGILAIATVTFMVNIFLFSRRALQMRLATLCMILLAAWYVVYGLMCYHVASGIGATWRTTWTAALPASALVLAYLAFRAILKDELLVRSLDRLR